MLIVPPLALKSPPVFSAPTFPPRTLTTLPVLANKVPPTTAPSNTFNSMFVSVPSAAPIVKEENTTPSNTLTWVLEPIVLLPKENESGGLLMTVSKPSEFDWASALLAPAWASTRAANKVKGTFKF